MDSDGFILVTYKKNKSKNSTHNKITGIKIDTILNIADLFNYVFAYTKLVDKLIFRLVSRKCKWWIDDRLKKKYLCDDLDEFMYYEKDVSIKKFVNNIMLYNYPELFIRSNGLFNNMGFDTQIIKYLLHIKSIYFLKKYVKYSCLGMYVCYFIINNFYGLVDSKKLSDNYDNSYKKNINKHTLKKSSCKDKINCIRCSKIIYLCVENDWYPPNNFFDNLPIDKIFNLMIVAGCHGSYYMFVKIYNYLNNLNYFSIDKLHMVSIIVCYYQDYYNRYAGISSRISLDIKLLQYTHNNVNIDSNFNKMTKCLQMIEGYERIIKWLCKNIYNHKINSDNDVCVSIIFKYSNRKYILTSFNDQYTNYDYLFFYKYVNPLEGLFINNYENQTDDPEQHCDNVILFKKYLLSPYV